MQASPLAPLLDTPAGSDGAEPLARTRDALDVLLATAAGYAACINAGRGLPNLGEVTLVAEQSGRLEHLAASALRAPPPALHDGGGLGLEDCVLRVHLEPFLKAHLPPGGDVACQVTGELDLQQCLGAPPHLATKGFDQKQATVGPCRASSAAVPRCAPSEALAMTGPRHQTARHAS